MIKDARHIYRVSDLNALEDKWIRALGEEGKERIRDSRTVQAYVNHSRWVANCPECNGGLACWRGSKTAVCLECAHEFFVLWPSAEDCDEIERVLLRRGSEANRNWYPTETVLSLKTENATNGEM